MTDDRRERYFFTSFEDIDDAIPMITSEYGKYVYDDFVDENVISARKIARQARFEYGETQKINSYK